MNEKNKDKSKKLLGNAIIMGVIVIAAKFLGLLRDILVASFFGTTHAAQAYETASRLPVLIFDFVIGGVVSVAFIPVFSSLLVKKDKKEAFSFANSYVNLILLITAAIAALGMVFSPQLVSLLAPELAPETKELAAFLSRIMFPMVIFTGLAYSFAGILQSLGEYTVPSLISLVSNSIMVLYLFTLNRVFGIIGLAAAMLLGWMSQAFVQMPSLHRLGYRYSIKSDFRSPYIKKALKNALPILIGTWTQPICSVINTRFASGLNDGRAVTAIGYANRLYTMIVGVFAFVATNLLYPYFSRANAEGNRNESNKLVTASVKILVYIIAPISAGMLVLAEPFCALIYQRNEFTYSDTLLTATALRCYTVGMIFMAVNEILVKAFYAQSRIKAPMISSIISMVFNIVLITAFSEKLGLGGIALASGIAMALNCTINYIISRKSGGVSFSAVDWLDILKSLVSSALMATVILFLKQAADGTGAFFTLVICTAAGVLFYALLTIAVKSEQSLFIVRRFLKKEDNQK